MNVLAPLEGIRVADFCWVLAGPFGTRVLANFGAEVIKIESNAHHGTRRRGKRPDGEPGPSVDPMFNDANTGKLSVTLNLRTEEGKEIAKRLIAKSDVVTNNFRAGAMERMGLGYDVLRAINPGIVLLHLPGCGHIGPWANVPTLGNMVMAASGISAITGFDGRPPSGMGVAYPDFTSPHIMVTTILAALMERDRTGKGQELNLSQLASSISLVGPEWMQYASNGQPPPRRANRDPNQCPHGVYPTRGDDQWCAIAASDNDEWAALCGAMGRPELASDARYADLAARKANEDEIDGILTDWTRGQDKWKLAELLQDKDVAAAAVEDLQDTLLLDPHMQMHYEHVTQPSDPDIDIVIDRDPIRLAGNDRPTPRAPMMGEHNGYVLGDLLELPQSEIERLTEDGVIG